MSPVSYRNLLKSWIRFLPIPLISCARQASPDLMHPLLQALARRKAYLHFRLPAYYSSRQGSEAQSDFPSTSATPPDSESSNSVRQFHEEVLVQAVQHPLPFC